MKVRSSIIFWCHLYIVQSKMTDIIWRIWHIWLDLYRCSHTELVTFKTPIYYYAEAFFALPLWAVHTPRKRDWVILSESMTATAHRHSEKKSKVEKMYKIWLKTGQKQHECTHITDICIFNTATSVSRHENQTHAKTKMMTEWMKPRKKLSVCAYALCIAHRAAYTKSNGSNNTSATTTSMIRKKIYSAAQSVRIIIKSNKNWMHTIRSLFVLSFLLSGFCTKYTWSELRCWCCLYYCYLVMNIASKKNTHTRHTRHWKRNNIRERRTNWEEEKKTTTTILSVVEACTALLCATTERTKNSKRDFCM